jgi:hypothetical protein
MFLLLFVSVSLFLFSNIHFIYISNIHYIRFLIVIIYTHRMNLI